MKVPPYSSSSCKCLGTLICILSLCTAAHAQRSAGYLSASVGYTGSRELAGDPSGELKLTIPANPYLHIGVGADLMKFPNLANSYTMVFTDLLAVLNPAAKGEKLFLTLQPGYGLYKDEINFSDAPLSLKFRGGFSIGGGIGTWIPVGRKLQLSLQPKYQWLGFANTSINRTTHESTTSRGHANAFSILFGIRI